MKLHRWKPKDPAWLAPVRERDDGLRVHLGGFINWPDGSRWSINMWTDTQHPLWLLACLMEPTKSRALMLFADMVSP